MNAVRWSREAQADLASITDYIAMRDQAAAERIDRTAIDATRFLAGTPQAGPVVPGTALRKWRVGRTPYLLLCRLDGGVLRVVRLVHGARNWPHLL